MITRVLISLAFVLRFLSSFVAAATLEDFKVDAAPSEYTLLGAFATGDGYLQLTVAVQPRRAAATSGSDFSVQEPLVI